MQVNILIDEEGKVRLTDFGLFFQAHGKSQQYVAIHSGADHWMAPELLDPGSFDPQERQLPFAADIYAFPCVCVEVSTTGPGVRYYLISISRSIRITIHSPELDHSRWLSMF